MRHIEPLRTRTAAIKTTLTWRRLPGTAVARRKNRLLPRRNSPTAQPRAPRVPRGAVLINNFVPESMLVFRQDRLEKRMRQVQLRPLVDIFDGAEEGVLLAPDPVPADIRTDPLPESWQLLLIPVALCVALLIYAALFLG